MSDFPYIHGFSEREQERLAQQARFGEHLIYRDVDFYKLKSVLEVGCGIGAQTEILLRRFPETNYTCIDLNDRQLEVAKLRLKNEPRVTIQKMDAANMQFDSNTFDGAFLCWILEHVPRPGNVLSEIRRVLKPGAKIVITEVMNSSFFLEPYSPATWKYWMAFNDYQLENAGDPFVGAKLGNYLLSNGFSDIQTNIKTFFFDKREPGRRRETIQFWTDLLLSASEQLTNAGVVDKETVEEMKSELQSVQTDPDAVFFYSFIQALAIA